MISAPGLDVTVLKPKSPEVDPRPAAVRALAGFARDVPDFLLLADALGLCPWCCGTPPEGFTCQRCEAGS